MVRLFSLAILQPRQLLPLLAGLAVLVRWTYLHFTGATFDDALISLRYAENLAAGVGLVFNPGERVFGASTPLYVLLLAGMMRLELPALLLAKLLAGLCDGVTLLLWGRWLKQRTGSGAAAAVFALLFAFHPLAVRISVSGMETSFALLALSLTLLSELRKQPMQMGLALGVLTLLRPEGAMVGAVLLAWRAVEQRAAALPSLARSALAAGLLVAPWMGWAIWFYGTPIPHSIVAKSAAYNAHRAGQLPNLLDTLSHLAPIRGYPDRLWLAMMVGLGVWMAVRRWRSDRDVRLLAVLLGAWWAYLVIPGTVLFQWYLPPFLLAAWVLAALGWERLAHANTERPWRLAGLGAITAGTFLSLLLQEGAQSQRLQMAEHQTRRAIGFWLRDRTPEGARVAMEPIGYIGYYSGRRILDEVGLVSPEMVPLNRQGAGWFARMARELQPDYIVERPGFLLRNRTIITAVPMFRDQGDQEDFLAEYELVRSFPAPNVPERLVNDYRFAIYQRRSASEARAWRKAWMELGADAVHDLRVRALTGRVTPLQLRGLLALARAPLPPR